MLISVLEMRRLTCKGVVTSYVSLFTLECDVICISVWGCSRRRAAPASHRWDRESKVVYFNFVTIKLFK